jgi:hypothetical protein
MLHQIEEGPRRDRSSSPLSAEEKNKVLFMSSPRHDRLTIDFHRNEEIRAPPAK